MENSKKVDAIASLLQERRHRRRRFTPGALARVLSAELHLTPATPLYVAYSGGMDSHVLLHALGNLRERGSWRVHALHVDHGLQPDSAEWERHCAAVCAALAIPFRSERIVVQGIAERGLEDAARHARYAALARLLPPGAVLLTAHHRDDQAETVLLQLMRGAGVAGLAAMPALAEFAEGRLARPLLGFAREALADYAAQHQLRWIEDASNRDENLVRNFVRHRVLPVLAERWPQAAARMALAASHQGEALRLLDRLGDIDLAATADADGRLNIEAMLRLEPERQTNLVRYWIRTRGTPSPSERVLRQILDRARRRPASRHAVVRWRDVEVRRYRNFLVFQPADRSPPIDWESSWNLATALEIPETGWRLRTQATRGAGLATARVTGNTVHVRFRRGGERCRVRGHTHKVKKLLQEAGIPPWERARLPLVFIDGDLAAIGDRWICEPYAARPGEPGVMLVLERAAAG